MGFECVLCPAGSVKCNKRWKMKDHLATKHNLEKEAKGPLIPDDTLTSAYASYKCALCPDDRYAPTRETLGTHLMYVHTPRAGPATPSPETVSLASPPPPPPQMTTKTSKDHLPRTKLINALPMIRKHSKTPVPSGTRKAPTATSSPPAKKTKLKIPRRAILKTAATVPAPSTPQPNPPAMPIDPETALTPHDLPSTSTSSLPISTSGAISFQGQELKFNVHMKITAVWKEGRPVLVLEDSALLQEGEDMQFLSRRFHSS